MLGRTRFASCGVPLALTAAIFFADVLATPLVGRDRFEPGDVVRYREDLTGGAWVVVGEYGFGRYSVRCLTGGRWNLLCIAEADELRRTD